MSDSDVRILMDMLDSNGDGQIGFNEFVEFASGPPQSSRSRRSSSLSKGARNSEDEGLDAISTDGPSIAVYMYRLKMAKISSSGIEKVYLQYRFPKQEYIRTHPQAVSNPKRKKQTVKLDHSKTVSVARGSSARKTLKAALRANKCRVQVQLVG
eukprot:CAMPEP_0184556608 /NCGR_PEP_ID=MMETSP0199_2-20130426/40669_1 /TAXON_ID=1112570 /ORGANISM="Thraustochytrium sp., Strain LLF1b" /LENGTH=153 /DNA_ID=CAMNT_0026953279 /DNA_START=90 /DNA_END=547 /DNA_ORIENTATION=-